MSRRKAAKKGSRRKITKARTGPVAPAPAVGVGAVASAATGQTRSIGAELAEAVENREGHPIPLEVRVRAQEVLTETRRVIGEAKAAHEMRGTVVEEPFRAKAAAAIRKKRKAEPTSLVFNASDDDQIVTVDAEEYAIPAQKTTSVPRSVGAFLGYGISPNFPGLVVLGGDGDKVYDESRKREARDSYILWVGRFVHDTLRAWEQRTAGHRATNTPLPDPDPTTLKAMLLAKKYEGKLVA